MVFSSVTFLFYFLPVCLGLHFLARTPAARNRILLAFSLLFYAWGEPAYVLLMLGSILGNWYCGKRIGEALDTRSRGIWLSVSLFANLGLLGIFKYLSFALQTLNTILPTAITYPDFLLNIALPIGISFYTFQSMSYLIDVYKGSSPYERNLLDLGTYIAMFPQLVAGPIVRYAQIKEELHANRRVDRDLINGACTFVIGLAFKVLLADTFAKDADHVFSMDAAQLSLALAWLGAVSYSFQIYFDFAGYSLMAIGLGRLLGFTFPINFDVPYSARSITDFWRRWHISLTGWFRDYLYVPLGGNRAGRPKTYRNLFVVFVLCGLWHGAAWTFVFWGCYQGLFLTLERMLRGTNVVVPSYIRRTYTLLVVVFGWVLFRSDSRYQMGHYTAALVGMHENPGASAYELLSWPYVALVLIGCYLSVYRVNHQAPPGTHRAAYAVPIYLGLFVASVVYLIAGTHSPFIYFRF